MGAAFSFGILYFWSDLNGWRFSRQFSDLDWSDLMSSISIDPDLAAALIAAIFGGGGLFALFFKWIDNRQSRPVSELVSLADVQKQIREEVRLENASLREDVGRVKAALVALTDIIDEVLPSIQGLTSEQKMRLHQANNAAKLAV